MAPDDNLDKVLEDEEKQGRLCDEAARGLRFGNMAAAQKAVEQLLAEWPESTSAHELAGDVAMAQGQLSKARKEYRIALELEPANVDAERKYGLSLLTLSPDEHRQQLLDEVLAGGENHRPSARKPINAALSGLVFPGLGQLYNREHEKGLGMLAGGALLLMLLFYLLVQTPYALMARQSSGDRVAVHNQLEGTREALTAMGSGYWVLVVLVILLYALLYLWGIYDAWQKAHPESERTLGL
jgi:tetratricopeptide (TPR) repeat protein